MVNAFVVYRRLYSSPLPYRYLRYYPAEQKPSPHTKYWQTIIATIYSQHSETFVQILAPTNFPADFASLKFRQALHDYTIFCFNASFNNILLHKIAISLQTFT